MSMAHGLESRVPFLDHPLVEFAASIPPNVKFPGGDPKHVLKKALGKHLPPLVLNREDKMGFPVPLTEWIRGDARDFVRDTLSCRKAMERDLINNRVVLEKLDSAPQFSREVWGFLSLEIWQQQFHDRAADFRALLAAPATREAA